MIGNVRPKILAQNAAVKLRQQPVATKDLLFSFLPSLTPIQNVLNNLTSCIFQLSLAFLSVTLLQEEMIAYTVKSYFHGIACRFFVVSSFFVSSSRCWCKKLLHADFDCVIRITPENIFVWLTKMVVQSFGLRYDNRIIY